MSDSDDDYMSDKFLNSLDTSQDDVRPGLLFNRTTKRQHEIYKKQAELKLKKPKTHREIEDELREKGLNTAITTDNKGYKLLEKMGFKPGQSLGKSGDTGIKEPIKIELKASKSGIGRDNEIKQRIVKRQQFKEENFTNYINEFKNTTKEKNLMRFLIKDVIKAQKICEELDTRNNIEEPIEDYYWTKLTLRKKRGIDEENDEEMAEFDENFEKYSTDENLKNLIDYLRERYFYCIYCGFIADDFEDLNNSCPGPYRIDHDDD